MCTIRIYLYDNDLKCGCDCYFDDTGQNNGLVSTKWILMRGSVCLFAAMQIKKTTMNRIVHPMDGECC